MCYFSFPARAWVGFFVVLLLREVGSRVIGVHPLRPPRARDFSVDEVHSLAVWIERTRGFLDPRRMLEPDRIVIRMAGNLVDLHAEPRVVHHPHEVPSRQRRHAILAIVPCPRTDLGAASDCFERHFARPEHPAPLLP